MTSRNISIFIGALLVLLYVALFASLSGLPFLDLPTHLARAFIVHELAVDPNSYFHQFYIFNPGFDPYILGDLLIAATISLIEPLNAGTLWMCIAFVAFPLSLIFYGLRSGLSRRTMPVLLLIGLFLGSNWMFLSAYLNFHLALATTFLALGFAENTLKAKTTAQATINSLLVLVWTVATYLLHPANFLFLCIGLGITTLFRMYFDKAPYLRAFGTLFPGIAMSMLYVSKMKFGANSQEPVVFRPWLEKLTAFGTMFVRYDLLTDIALFILCLAALWLVARQSKSFWLRTTNSWLYFLLGTTCLILFLILPVAALRGYDVDIRALPYGFAFLTLLVLDQVPADEETSPFAIMTAALLAILNLAYLTPYLRLDNERCERIIMALKQLPEGKKILPVVDTPPVERVHASLHTAELYAPLRKGFNPYTTGSQHGGPTEHFQMRRWGNVPSLFWVIRPGAYKFPKDPRFQPDIIFSVDNATHQAVQNPSQLGLLPETPVVRSSPSPQVQTNDPDASPVITSGNAQ